jgi:flagellar hook-associated protein 3 FlgL
MRISNNMIFERTLRDINANRKALADAQRDITTGKRLHRGSDDPAATAQIQLLLRNASEASAYLDNVDAAKNFLRDTDAALSNQQDILLQLQDRFTQAASGALTQETRQQLALEMRSLQDAMRQVANSQDGQGRYLFNGAKTSGEPPYPAGDLTLGTQGAGTLVMEIGRGTTIQASVNGAEVFGDPQASERTDIFQVVDDFVDFLASGKSDATAPGSLLSVPQLALKNLNDNIRNLISVRGSVASRLQSLENTSTKLSEQKMMLEGRLEELQAVDLPTASVKFNQYDAAFRAALAVSGRTLPTSLVDYLR